MTKREQCKTCQYFGCSIANDCNECAMHSDTLLECASHLTGKATCMCLTVEYDKPCPYYKEVIADD